MRFFEFSSGLITPLNNEEKEILDIGNKIYPEDMSERQQYVADGMYRRDILLIGNDEQGKFYYPNTINYGNSESD